METTPQTYDIPLTLQPGIRFVALAQKGPFLPYIHIERDNNLTTIVASDGRRLHFLSSPQLPAYAPGDYDLLSSGKTLILTPVDNSAEHAFPNWRKIMPPEKPATGPDRLYTFDYKKSDTTPLSQMLYRLTRDLSQPIDYRFLLGLAFLGPFSVQTEATGKPILCIPTDSDHRFGARALIMPMSANNL